MQTRLILWAGILSSSLIFAVVSQVAPLPVVDGSQTPMLPIALAMAALMNGVVSLFLPPMIAKQAVARLALPTEESPPFGDLPAGTKIFVDPDVARERALVATLGAYVVRLAMRESIAIFGLILAFSGYPFRTYVQFFVFGTALVALAFPRKAEVDLALESAYGARLKRHP